MEPIYIRTPWLLAKIIGDYTAMTVRPFIFKPRGTIFGSIISKHELCHFRRQGEIGLLRYLWLYWRDKGFRLNEELVATVESVEDESDSTAYWEFDVMADELHHWYGIYLTPDEIMTILKGRRKLAKGAKV